MANNAKIIDVDTILAAGINPKTGLPIKGGSSSSALKNDIKRFLRIIDEQDAINRYEWKNIPANITSQELERMLYYKGQLAFFYIEDLDEYFFMPYALDGTIDFYGRYNRIHPVPMANGTTENDKSAKAQADYLSTLKLDCVYTESQIEKKKDKKCCVLLHDYAKQLSQIIIARQIINDPILDVMSECVPFLRTSLVSGSGIKGVRVNDADQESSVREGSKSLITAAMNSDPWVPIVGNLEFQELTDGSVLKSEEFMLAMQSLDNLRLQGYGLENGGLFEKQAHELQTEADINGTPIELIMEDGLKIRQNFCDVANKMFNCNISVEIKQSDNEMNMGGAPDYEKSSDNDREI